MYKESKVKKGYTEKRGGRRVVRATSEKKKEELST